MPAAYLREVVIYDESEDAPDPLVPNSIVTEDVRPVEARVEVEIDTRGYRFELTPPVPIEVLEGNVRGRRRQPIEAFRLLPEELEAQVREEAAADEG